MVTLSNAARRTIFGGQAGGRTLCPKGSAIPHFDGYAAVLIQLRTVTEQDLRDALLDG
jgi:hypothetical protein